MYKFKLHTIAYQTKTLRKPFTGQSNQNGEFIRNIVKPFKYGTGVKTRKGLKVFFSEIYIFISLESRIKELFLKLVS